MSCDLYRLYDAEDQLLYVGISWSAIVRMAQHKAEKPWFGDVARIEIVITKSRSEAQHLELQAIRDEWPLYNKQHNTNRMSNHFADCICDRFTDFFAQDVELCARHIWKVIAERDGSFDELGELLENWDWGIGIDALNLAKKRRWIALANDRTRWVIGPHIPDCQSGRIWANRIARNCA
jgi:hypothetical protein